MIIIIIIIIIILHMMLDSNINNIARKTGESAHDVER